MLCIRCFRFLNDIRSGEHELGLADHHSGQCARGQWLVHRSQQLRHQAAVGPPECRGQQSWRCQRPPDPAPYCGSNDEHGQTNITESVRRKKTTAVGSGVTTHLFRTDIPAGGWPVLVVLPESENIYSGWEFPLLFSSVFHLVEYFRIAINFHQNLMLNWN